MSKKIIVIFVEGQSEEKFYSLLCRYFQKEVKTSNKIIIKNLKGIGNYANKAHAKLKHEILSKHKISDILVYLCYDSDVFEIPFQQKPPINWKTVEMKIKELGLSKIYHIKANKSIEDWFLIDLKGLCHFLNIKQPKKLKGRSGYEKICNLFKTSYKIYQKGYNVNNFVEKLDYNLLANNLKDETSELKSNM